MIKPEVLDALLAAGASAEMIVAAVKADLRQEEIKAQEKRAKDAARQRKHRNKGDVSRDVTVTPCDERDPPNDIYSNPPESSPEETIVSSTPKPKSVRAKSGLHPLPDGWEPHLTPTAQQIVDGWPPGWLEARVSEFRDHATDKGRKSKDWQAAFRTWITKADEWQRQRGQHGNDRKSSANGHSGRDGFINALREVADRQAADPFTENC